ncbi:MAG: hypothetical protein JNL38_31725 [Myxococcales bacterium]|nr:hypothetical protein [Myxococcales bacterium]
MRRVAAALLCLALGGCAALRPMWASSADLDDYKAYRVADDAGVRLARAYAYLERHPGGAWAAEVRATVEEEEPAYFVRCQATRPKMLEYLTNLPRGPHAEQALSLLVAFDRGLEDAESDRMLREARITEATLEKASVARRRVGERILGGLAVLLDGSLVGARVSDLSPVTRRYFEGPAPSTWGGRTPELEEDLYFLLPARPERLSRLLTLRAELTVEEGVVTAARLRGDDLLVKWYESTRIVALDPDKPGDRTEAFSAGVDVLKGAAEAAFPAAACDAPTEGRELMLRRCKGRELRVVASERAGQDDVIEVRLAKSR